MTKADFDFIANEFRWQNAEREFCLQFGVALMLKDYPDFDLNDFMTACGFPPPKD